MIIKYHLNTIASSINVIFFIGRSILPLSAAPASALMHHTPEEVCDSFSNAFFHASWQGNALNPPKEERESPFQEVSESLGIGIQHGLV